MRKLLHVFIIVLLMLSNVNGQTIKEMQFENVKLETVLKALSQAAGISVVFDPAISQDLQKTVSISVNRPISVNESLNIILKEYNLIAVPVNQKVYRITKAGEITIVIKGLSDPQVNQIITFLKERVSPTAEIVVDRTAGVIFIRDEEKNIKRLESISKDIRSIAEKISPLDRETKVFYFKGISLNEAIQILEKYKTKDTLFTPVETFNALIITDSIDNIKKYEGIFGDFLAERPKERRPVTKIFYLKYISPEEFIKLIEPLRSEAGLVLSGGTFVQQATQQQTQQQATTQLRTPIIKEFNAVMVTDFPEVIDKIKERFSEYISDAPVRVLIEARIIEANEDVTFQLGLSFNAIITDATRVPSQYSVGAGSNVGVNLPLPNWWKELGPAPRAGSLLVASYQKGILNALNLRLAAYEKLGKSKSIAKPSIVTINGQKATIKQGVEIPYRTTAVGGGGTAIPTIQFKEVVLQLDVTPVVSPDGRVLLDVELKRDIPLDVGLTEPPLRKNEVKSKLIVEDGQTIVIGGVIDDTSTQTNEGLPGAVRVPLLKWIFGQEARFQSNRELLIFITPIVMKQ